MDIFREFGFEAAHRLPHVPDGHKCGRLHGHSYRVEVRVRGDVDPSSGMVVDFADLSAAFGPLHDQLDHHTLNGVAGLANPTAENLAVWIWQRLDLPGLTAVTVRETANCGATYRGPGGDAGCGTS